MWRVAYGVPSPAPPPWLLACARPSLSRSRPRSFPPPSSAPRRVRLSLEPWLRENRPPCLPSCLCPRVSFSRHRALASRNLDLDEAALKTMLGRMDRLLRNPHFNPVSASSPCQHSPSSRTSLYGCSIVPCKHSRDRTAVVWKARAGNARFETLEGRGGEVMCNPSLAVAYPR